MRRLLLATLLAAACGPKVHMGPSPFEEDDPRAGAARSDEPRRGGPAGPASGTAPGFDELPVAPAGPAAREGVVSRAALAPVLDAGPVAVMRHLELAAEHQDGRFAGWRLVAIDPAHHPFAGVDVAPGDVLVAINGRALSSPDDLHAVWDGLRRADAIVADLRRDRTRVQLRWTIEGPPLPPATRPR